MATRQRWARTHLPKPIHRYIQHGLDCSQIPTRFESAAKKIQSSRRPLGFWQRCVPLLHYIYTHTHIYIYVYIEYSDYEDRRIPPSSDKQLMYTPRFTVNGL